MPLPSFVECNLLSSSTQKIATKSLYTHCVGIMRAKAKLTHRWCCPEVREGESAYPVDTLSVQFMESNNLRFDYTWITNPKLVLRFSTSDMERPTLKFKESVKKGEVIGTLPSKIRKGAGYGKGYRVLERKGEYVSYKILNKAPKKNVSSCRFLRFSQAREESNCKVFIKGGVVFVKTLRDVLKNEPLLLLGSV